MKVFGNISACAENTWCFWSFKCPWKKHLRMRGEYTLVLNILNLHIETSPHARRIPFDDMSRAFRLRNISACAENTSLKRKLSLIV